MVEWMFGTTEFSAWSDSLDAGITGPYMSMHSKDAEHAGLSDGDRVSVELDNGTRRSWFRFRIARLKEYWSFRAISGWIGER